MRELKEVAGTVCDKSTNKLKLQSYCNIIRPVMMHGLKTKTLRREEQRLEQTEMRMMRWIMGISLHERLEIEEIGIVGGEKITDAIIESILCWYDYVARRASVEPVWGRKQRGKQRIIWHDKVKDNLQN